MKNESSWVPRSRLQLLVAAFWLGLRSGRPFRYVKSARRLLRGDLDGIDREKGIEIITKELALAGGGYSETWLRWQAAEIWDEAFHPNADHAPKD